MEGRRRNVDFGNRCLTMHQPWASLLVHGIKHIEGRSWPAPFTGRLWIHAASKVPDDAIIETMENFYREIYAANGVSDLKFPQHYPVSRLIGCIEVVGCLRREELARWKEVPEGVRLEALTDFCWLCEQPQKLSVPLEMRGWHGVYDLESKIYKAAIEVLVPAESPLPVKFPLPNPQDSFSLKPGSISSCLLEPVAEKSPRLRALMTAASLVAATQFSNKGQSSKHNRFHSKDNRKSWRPEATGFNNNIQNYGFNSRNQTSFARPAPAAPQIVKRDENIGSSNGFESRYRRSFYRPASMQYVKEENQIVAVNSLGNNFNRQHQTEDK